MDLNQVTIYSADVRKLAAFYSELGFRLIVDSIPRYARFECPSGDATFSLHETDSPTDNSGIVLYFECEDVNGEFERLSALGIEFEHGPADQSWLWREARFRDPDGNRLVLYHAGTNRRNPPWRIENTD